MSRKVHVRGITMATAIALTGYGMADAVAQSSKAAEVSIEKKASAPISITTLTLAGEAL